jgi:chromosome segregation ATPase
MLSVVGDSLIEVLLSVVLMFNVGAYSFLWYKIRNVEDDVEQNQEQTMKLFKRIFGIEEDSTDPGHLVETEKRFHNLNERLDSIEDKIDNIQTETKESHRETRSLLENIVSILVEEDNIDADESDIKNNR